MDHESVLKINVYIFSLFDFCKCVTLVIQQNIFRFEVSVDDPLLVEVLHALDDLSSVVTGPRLIKARVVLIHIIDVIPGGIGGIPDEVSMCVSYRTQGQSM